MKAESTQLTPFDADLRRAGLDPRDLDKHWYGVVIVDADGRVVLTNRAARKILRISDEPEKAKFDLIPDASSSADGPPLESALSGQSRWCVPYILHGAEDQSEVPVSATSFALRDSSTEIIGAVLLCHLTEGWGDEARHALDARIHAAQQRELTSTMAHEVNQPLSAIYMYSRGCLRRFRDGQIEAEDLQEALEAMSEQALRAGEIVRKLREYPSGDAGSLVRECIDEVASSAVAAARPMAELWGVRFVEEFNSGRCCVKVDRARMEMAILHLLRNAIESMGSEEIESNEVNIVTSRNDTEVELRVEDRGIGLPTSLEGSVTEPFTTTKESNRGLGLSFSNSIAQAHGGHLQLGARPGGGTVASITLPIEPEDPSHDPAKC